MMNHSFRDYVLLAAQQVPYFGFQWFSAANGWTAVKYRTHIRILLFQCFYDYTTVKLITFSSAAARHPLSVATFLFKLLAKHSKLLWLTRKTLCADQRS